MDEQDKNLIKILAALSRKELELYAFGVSFGLRHVMHNITGCNPEVLEVPDLNDSKLKDKVEAVTVKVRDMQHQMLNERN